MIGQQILNYKIISLLGEGGMGAVYLAEHTQVNRKVAIKVLHAQFFKNEDIKLRFKNEASTMAHLQHPNIVGLLDYLEDENGMYLIMEYIEGVGLDEYINNSTGPMPEDKAVPIMKQILSAFSYAHDKKIVHRDIKPANILISPTGEVKVLDFGIARLLGDNDQNLTKTGTQMGTVFYMSPEQVQGKKVDHLSDIYSLGVTFYQMLTGVNPYRGLTTDYEVYNKIVKEDLPDPSSVYPGVPSYFKQILKKATAKDKENRFKNCNEFSQALDSKKAEVNPTNSQNNSSQSSNQSTSQNQHIHFQRKNSYSSASLVLGIFSLILSFIPFVNVLSIILGILAIVNGKKAIKQAETFKEFQFTDRGGKSGKTLGFISFFILILVYLVIFLMYFFKDTDGDGVYDRNDNCLYEYGNTKEGCPDQDGDGIFDYEDGCPELYGSEDTNGCPDSDGDGVYDNEDQCPNEVGSIDNYGCPYSDRDNDGIIDEEDSCPDERGPESNNGCMYEVKCPYCENYFKVEVIDTWKNCNYCGNSFYTCRKSNGDYGIRQEWIQDGGCDCSNCNDEEGYD
jgi:serine/threonine protein kinase